MFVSQIGNLLDEVGLGISVGYQELAPGDPKDGTVLEQSVPSSRDQSFPAARSSANSDQLFK